MRQPVSTNEGAGKVAEVWTREKLSARDRRLPMRGSIVTHGAPGVWKLQVKSALANGELMPTELRKTLVTLASHAGYPNVAPLVGITERAIAYRSATPTT